MKKKFLSLLVGTVMLAALFTGCGSSETTETVATETTEATTETVEATTDTTEATVEADSETTEISDADDEAMRNQMEYMTQYYVFGYLHSDFMAFEQDNDGCTLSYINESIQAAGSNVLTITVELDTTYDAAIEKLMTSYGVTDYTPVEITFGADGITAYTCYNASESSEGSGLRTSDLIYAIPDEDNVILLDCFRTLGDDEESEMQIDAAFQSVFDSFELMDVE